MFAASISDVDDITNLLIAYQTEWNKLHSLLRSNFPTYQALKKSFYGPGGPSNPTDPTEFLKRFNVTLNDFNAFTIALGKNWKLRLRHIYKSKINLRLQLLAGSWIDYTKATQKWWKNISLAYVNSPSNPHKIHLSTPTIYFVSSNTHSLINLTSGFVLKHQTKILQYIKSNFPELYSIWKTIESKDSLLNPNDFLYFASKFYFKETEHQQQFDLYLQSLGIINVPSSHYLDINTQIIPLNSLINSKSLDPRLKVSKPQLLQKSNSVILNIDYPLGFAAYHILSETLANAYKIKGVYVMGKAAVLNGEIGDIQVHRLVFDEHTQNSYIFKNCFNSFFPFVNNQGSILTNQKAVSVLGTFLENEALLETYSKNNLTVIEMESGPYLNAITEASYDQQTPKNTIIDLNNAPFDVGILNYTSDTPYSKAKNLGVKNLTLDGIEPVYLCSLAILQRIINLEEQT